MIYIKRKVPIPESIVEGAKKEHESAEEYYSIKRTKFIAFKHKVYQQADVKKALETEFDGKCAYCESKVMTTSAIDKEHFRPKASIIDKERGISIKPGYYWLAADWSNLLLACAHCNRTGTFETNMGEEFVSGKLDRFPLSDEGKRLNKGEDLSEEEKVRLLINPCIDKPETWINYDEMGMIYPSQEIDDHKREMVKTSIETFGLHRSDLVNARKEQLLTIQEVMENLFDNYNDYLNGNQVLESLKRIRRNFDSLKRQKTKDKEYLGIKRRFIKKELEKLKEIIRVLPTD